MGHLDCHSFGGVSHSTYRVETRDAVNSLQGTRQPPPQQSIGPQMSIVPALEYMAMKRDSNGVISRFGSF